MDLPRWNEGRLSTGFIAEEFPAEFTNPAPAGAVALRLACGGGGDRRQAQRPQAPHLRPDVGGAARGVRAPPVRDGGGRPLVFTLEGAEGDGRWRVEIEDEGGFAVESAWRPGDPVLAWHGRGGPDRGRRRAGAERRAPVACRRLRRRPRLHDARGRTRPAHARQGRRAAPANRCSAPCRGCSARSLVGEGQAVKTGESLAVVEAMKMENVLKAERDGTVARILVRPGDSLGFEAVILEFA